MTCQTEPTMLLASRHERPDSDVRGCAAVEIGRMKCSGGPEGAGLIKDTGSEGCSEAHS